MYRYMHMDGLSWLTLQVKLSPSSRREWFDHTEGDGGYLSGQMEAAKRDN